MRTLIPIAIAVLAIAGCQRRASESTAPEPAARAAPLNITGRTPFQLSQRTTGDLPGSDGRYRVTIDDITRGQVMVSIAARDGASVIAPTSMSPGGTLELTVGEVGYVIVLEALNNQLIGDDSAEFSIVPLAVYSPMADPGSDAPPAPDEGEPKTERELIDALVAHVRGLEGAVFIRNGTEHSPADAADHMRLKQRNAGARVKTAEDFIRYCATESSISGKPYTIRMADGREVGSGEYLTGVLRELREK